MLLTSVWTRCGLILGRIWENSFKCIPPPRPLLDWAVIGTDELDDTYDGVDSWELWQGWIWSHHICIVLGYKFLSSICYCRGLGIGVLTHRTRSHWYILIVHCTISWITCLWYPLLAQLRALQGCISCGILVSGIRACGVSSEHMENVEMFSCSPT